MADRSRRGLEAAIDLLSEMTEEEIANVFKEAMARKGHRFGLQARITVGEEGEGFLFVARGYSTREHGFYGTLGAAYLSATDPSISMAHRHRSIRYVHRGYSNTWHECPAQDSTGFVVITEGPEGD